MTDTINNVYLVRNNFGYVEDFQTRALGANFEYIYTYCFDTNNAFWFSNKDGAEVASSKAGHNAVIETYDRLELFRNNPSVFHNK